MNMNEYEWILQYRMFLQQGMEIINVQELRI